MTTDYTLGGLMPFLFGATCPRCGEDQIISSDGPEKPEPEVCDVCHDGIVRWRKISQ